MQTFQAGLPALGFAKLTFPSSAHCRPDSGKRVRRMAYYGGASAGEYPPFDTEIAEPQAASAFRRVGSLRFPFHSDVALIGGHPRT